MAHNPERAQEFITDFFTLLPPSEFPQIWVTFAEVTTIPRPSGKEEQIADYVEAHGQVSRMEVSRDRHHNVLLVVPATEGFEDSPSILLQVHSDMVPEKDNDADLDPSLHGVRARVHDKEWVKADKTTLGADNGMGLSVGLEILKDNRIRHGRLGLLVTTDEEKGLNGASKLELDLSGFRYLINLDSEEEGEATIGCAGAGYTDIEISLDTEPLGAYSLLDIGVGGLAGGHSGIEIGKGGANGIKILAELLASIPQSYDLRLVNITGGNVEKDIKNAIPQRGTATVAVKAESLPEITYHLDKAGEMIKAGLAEFESGSFVFSHQESKQPYDRMLSKKSTDMIFDVTRSLPHGVYETKDGNVITSTNLALITIQDSRALISMMSRSAVGSSLEQMMEVIANKVKAHDSIRTRHLSRHAGWEPIYESTFIAIAGEIYRQVSGKGLQIKVTHGGLECGVIGEKFPHFIGNMISIGPTILDAHKTTERVHVPSVDRLYRYLTHLIEHLAA
ncbi:hypothetical protein A2Z33_01720 [Candidatus Gottesmanbacteria bacterium RBG_16_52_11]|uniref:Peptidase M20 dimerisation domain-containing protein n=1 Tax=Candidatus Gottesmanbacteria bacterium RBG_16_52_11 TaxID=1798374 RepID=A0A1F5YP75_9BACT|nr:MAG: hypothetical protein A2Z33_01720 [Candidatus Gottesmanbacteria bacterium RBG_16_52_11]